MVGSRKSSFNTFGGEDFVVFQIVQVFDLLLVHTVDVLIVIVHVGVGKTGRSFSLSHFLNLVYLIGLFLQADTLI